MTESGQVGVRRDLSGYIENIQRTDTPLFTLLPKGSVRSMTVETLVDNYGNTDDISGVGSGEDAGAFKNENENRGIVTNQCMKMWENPLVDDFAENVNEVEALPGGEYAEAVRKAIIRLKFRIEKLLLSQVEAQRQTGGKKYRTCSIGGYIKSTAPTGTQEVPEQFRPAAAQIYSSTLALLKETSLTSVLQEIFEATNGMGKFTMPSGSDLKKTISYMSVYRPEQSGYTTVKMLSGKDGATLETKVDIIVGDFGTITIVPTTRMRYFDGNGAATTQAQRRGSGYVLDLSRLELAFKRKPGHKSLENKGGGPRGIVDTIFCLRNKAPQGHGAVLVSG